MQLKWIKFCASWRRQCTWISSWLRWLASSPSRAPPWCVYCATQAKSTVAATADNKQWSQAPAKRRNLQATYYIIRLMSEPAGNILHHQAYVGTCRQHITSSGSCEYLQATYYIISHMSEPAGNILHHQAHVCTCNQHITSTGACGYLQATCYIISHMSLATCYIIGHMSVPAGKMLHHQSHVSTCRQNVK